MADLTVRFAFDLRRLQSQRRAETKHTEQMYVAKSDCENNKATILLIVKIFNENNLRSNLTCQMRRDNVILVLILLWVLR